MKFYISDLHLGHENVLLHDNRPFQNIEEMHHQMITRWNKVVSQTDEVYILGDFAWKNAIGDEVLSQLCGRKFLVLGNHDKPTTFILGLCRVNIIVDRNVTDIVVGEHHFDQLTCFQVITTEP